MALKKNISVNDWGKLPESLQTLYVEKGDGYALDLEGDDDAPELKRAKEHEKNRRKSVEQELREAREKLKEFETAAEEKLQDDLKRKGKYEELETSWKQKLKEERDGRKADNERYQATFRQMLVKDTAIKMAQELCTVPDLLAPVIESRLTIDFDGDMPTTRVLDAEGKVSASSLDDLKTEFLQNEKFSSIMIASKASGGAGSKSGSGAPTNQFDANAFGAPSQGQKRLSEMSTSELEAVISQKVDLKE